VRSRGWDSMPRCRVVRGWTVESVVRHVAPGICTQGRGVAAGGLAGAVARRTSVGPRDVRVVRRGSCGDRDPRWRRRAPSSRRGRSTRATNHLRVLVPADGVGECGSPDRTWSRRIGSSRPSTPSWALDGIDELPLPEPGRARGGRKGDTAHPIDAIVRITAAGARPGRSPRTARGSTSARGAEGDNGRRDLRGPRCRSTSGSGGRARGRRDSDRRRRGRRTGVFGGRLAEATG